MGWFMSWKLALKKAKAIGQEFIIKSVCLFENWLAGKKSLPTSNVKVDNMNTTLNQLGWGPS